MTISVRKSREFMGGPISLVAVSKMERWPFPVSVKRLTAPLASTTFPPSIVEAGDVTATVNFVMSNRGNWSVFASVHDSGTFFGDEFVLDVLLAGTPGVGKSYRDTLGTGDTKSFTDQGFDPFVRDHFNEITALNVHLHADPDVSVGEIVVTALFAVAVATFFLTGGPKVATPCPESTPEHPCVEFREASDG